MHAEEIISKLIYLLLTNLEDLKDITDDNSHQFEYGEKIAYIECLEAIQLWDEAQCFNLNYDIEKCFSV